MSSDTCKNGHLWSEQNTATRNGIRTCMACQRGAKAKGNNPVRKRTKARPRSVESVPGMERISLQSAIGHVVFDHVKVATAARWAGKAKATVADAAWEYVKRVVRDRDRNTCWKCGGRGSSLDVHHRKPKQMGGADSLTTYGLANLVSLCRGCHSRVHANPAESEGLGFILGQISDPAKIPFLARGESIVLTNGGLVEREVKFSE